MGKQSNAFNTVRRKMKIALLGGVSIAVVGGGIALAQSKVALSKYEALFKTRCAGCHDPNVDRAPSRDDLSHMLPSQIVGALNGSMVQNAKGLSDEDKRGLAALLGVKSAAATESAAPAFVNTPHTLGPAQPAEWHNFNGNLASARYAPVDQINKDTVKYLHVVWRQSLTPDAVKRMVPNAPVPSSNNETTPLMIGGMLYYSTGIGGVTALNPATGEVLWHVDAPLGSSNSGATVAGDGDVGPAGGASRSVAYWDDAKGGRIIAVLGNKYLTALDPKTGERIKDFGEGGQIDLSKGIEKPGSVPYRWRTGPTVVVRGVVIVSMDASDINSAGRHSSIDWPRGDIRGIDAKTGKVLWTWHSIPQKGEFGNDTWLNDSWKYSGNTNVWSSMSGDESLGMVYLPETTPTDDWYGGARPGNGLFAESIIALDARTGKRVWHFQGVHHGIWDYDFPCPPVLVDIKVNGKAIKGLAQPSKQSYLYVLDRETGKPIWPIVERPVPAGDAPGEWYAPTQPVPLDSHGNPFAYDLQGVGEDNLINYTPELHKEAVELLKQYAYGPMFFPVVVKDQGKGAGKLGSLHLPGTYGGTNWPGAGFDPETDTLYIPSAQTPVVARLVPPPAGSDTKLVREGYLWPKGPQGLPLFKGPYGSLIAVDLDKGEIKWKVANGDGPRDNPALKNLNLPQLGEPGRVGLLVTKSLVFMGEGMTQDPPGSGGKKFRAYDKTTGQVVWETTLDGETTGVPMSYTWQGKQYILVPIGGRGHPGEFVAMTAE